MLNALDNLPEDPVELRRVTELLASEVKAQALMIEKLQHQLYTGQTGTVSDPNPRAWINCNCLPRMKRLQRRR